MLLWHPCRIEGVGVPKVQYVIEFVVGKDSTVVTVIRKPKVSDADGANDSCLVVINGSDLGKKYPLVLPSTIIGRSAKADIQVDEDAVSRSHAEIVNADGIFSVHDRRSTNGTFVNEQPITTRELRDGDQIQVGRTIFKFLSGSNIESLYHDEIYRLTTVDGLTQAYNKRFFMSEIEKEMSRALRYGRELSLILIDLDHFSQVNNTLGHLAGDFVLRQVASRISSSIRRDDIFARYGGEEFALILPEITRLQASKLGEKLRSLLDGHPFEFDEHTIPVTMSLGVADLAEYKMRIEDPYTIMPQILIKIADERLYKAKRNGRNQVSWR